MKIFCILLILFLICVCISLAVWIINMRKTAKFNETQLLKMLRQLRYGQLQVDLSSYKNESIKTSSEQLIEALSDREKMLSEYKQILIAKNKSLEQMIEVEKESQKFKDDFVAALTHDLKTPVIAEVNAIKMLLAGNFGEISQQQKEVLEMMLKSDQDLIELSEMLLTTYKYQQAEVEMHPVKTDVCEFTRSIFEELYPILNPKNQKPVFNCNKPKLYADIDHVQFKRVLSNLILNGSKYGYNDTDLIVEISEFENEIQIKIINNGDDINPEDAKLIFEKYYSGIKKFSHLGTGLGLYCANKIVSAHKGKIDVSSENQVTVFTVTINKSTQ